MWKVSNNVKGTKKQVRKPISNNFAPKRLAINFQPPTIILQYLVIDTGKLYHHKMRLDSILRKTNVNRMNILDYIKTKHHLYFLSTKLKDQQILKFIDKILMKLGKSKPQLDKITQKGKHLESSPSVQLSNKQPSPKQQQKQQQDDDFDYLNDDDEYQQDYQDYEEQPKLPVQKQNKQLPVSSFSTKQSAVLPPSQPQEQKNTFMTYCQDQYDQDNQSEGQANWDLQIDQNADFDFV